MDTVEGVTEGAGAGAGAGTGAEADELVVVLLPPPPQATKANIAVNDSAIFLEIISSLVIEETILVSNDTR